MRYKGHLLKFAQIEYMILGNIEGSKLFHEDTLRTQL
jgi:hypothetical protein